MGTWNLADIWEMVADELPDADCLVHGTHRRTWAEVDRRADGVARFPLDAAEDLRGTFAGPGARFLPACPQMHGTGNFPCLSTLAGGSAASSPAPTPVPSERKCSQVRRRNGRSGTYAPLCLIDGPGSGRRGGVDVPGGRH